MHPILATTLICAYLGIDVAKDTLDVVLHLAGQKVHRVFANSPLGFVALHGWLRSLPAQQFLICLEATGSYSDGIAHFLAEQGYAVAVLNPAILVHYRKSENIRSKNDKLDAELLARYGQEKRPRLWKPVPPDVLTLRLLLAYRDDVLGMLRQERNRLHAGRLTTWTRAQIEQHSQQLAQRLKAAEQQLKAHLTDSPELLSIWLRLQTIPGIGWLTAASLIASIGEISRFARVGALVSLAGLAIKEQDSGTSVHGRPQIDRHGHAHLRQVLYWCAITAMRTDPQIGAWAQRLRQRGKPNKIVIVAVMRKLLHIAYGVWKSGTDYDPQLVLGAVA